MTVSVVIGYFGDRSVWEPLAERAAESARSQSVPVEVILSYRSTLQAARNEGALAASGEWLVFLDADDSLDTFYVEHLLAGEGDVRQPATLGVYPDGSADDAPVVIQPRGKNLLGANHLIIGCMVRRSLFLNVGGFADLPAMEDWDLWLRCWLEGATFGVCPDAVYRVSVYPGSRNTMSDQYADLYRSLRAKYSLEATRKGLV